MRLMYNELFRLQALASSSLTATETHIFKLLNADQPDLPFFALDYMVLYTTNIQEDIVIISTPHSGAFNVIAIIRLTINSLPPFTLEWWSTNFIFNS